MLLEDYAGVRPGAKQDSHSSSDGKKVLLLGSGFVAKPAADYVVKKGYQLTIGEQSEH